MKHIFIVAFLCLSILGVKAQKQELSVSYSPLSIYRFEKIFEGTEAYEDNYHVLGAFNLNYLYHFNSWFKAGVNIMYDRASKDGISSYYTLETMDDPAFKTRVTKQAFILAPEFDFQYLNHPKLKLSSSLSVGYAFEFFEQEGYYNSNYGMEGLTYHLNLIGFKWGQKHGLTGQIGFGYKGALNLGYFIRF
ncbi:hypothetical protein [Carboxylicivirga linearis]|uniref:Outer membrane protein beta-barrel domain-containing protein n=1 Tax=Carboxylicivirga linearis TaxID=1628157 RepID=A0ABS5JRX7_9BACT|nr:hypothetical protein [Carboxylicivirga linearis]MBS2097583.1 hypothetical protein [Carboxylicivirga linearis]